MNYKDYPALFKAADLGSNIAQRTYLRLIKLHILLLILGAGLTINPIPTKEYSLFNALIFFSALGVSILLATKNYEKTWYSSRALAESVKTATWRFMMKADPFLDAESVKEVKTLFRDLLTDILRTNNQLGEILGGIDSTGDQISNVMSSTRSLSLDERKSVYLNHRIDEQRQWYATKSTQNKRKGKQAFFMLIVFQALALVSVLLRIAYPEWFYWPTDIFVVAAGGVVTWIQLKRYRELAAAYSLTVHEIGIIRGKLQDADNDKEFSEFVRDSENAFSREHTQWVAKHDT